MVHRNVRKCLDPRKLKILQLFLLACLFLRCHGNLPVRVRINHCDFLGTVRMISRGGRRKHKERSSEEYFTGKILGDLDLDEEAL